MSANTSVIEHVPTTIVQPGGTTSYPREVVAVSISAAAGSAGLPAGVQRAATGRPPLRLGEQPASGLPRYRDFERRRRHAQIAARHALELASAS